MSVNAPTIDVHIGTEKTGTTSIQHFLQRNRETLLNQHGICYPRCLGDRLSTNLAAACERPEKPDDLQRLRELDSPQAVADYYDRLRDSFVREVADSGASRVLISSEHLCSRLKTEEDLLRLREFLHSASDRVRIYLYLRRQDDFVLSLYSTSIKSGETLRFMFPAPGKARHDMYYDRLLQRWQAVFDTIEVGLYDRQRLLGNSIVTDFCHRLTLPDGLEVPEREENVALGAAALEFLREFNELVPRFVDGRLNPLRADIAQALGSMDIPGDKFRGDGGNRAFMSQFEQGNSEIARRWFADDPSVPATLFAPTDDDGAVAPQQPFDRQQLLAVAAHLWCFSQSKVQASREWAASLHDQLAREREAAEMRANTEDDAAPRGFLARLLRRS
ncbi:MAG: hypothetical protein R3228_17145 [Halioglobus sp.]|nr:hypothetical protein [Halioglobus sp.]